MPSDRWGVSVEGLDETLRALRKAGDKMSAREVGQAGKSAADIVAQRAKTKVPVLTGRARDSVRAAVVRGGGAVRGGKATVPYYGFLDFGNKPHQGRGVGRGDSHPRPFIARGRFIYPTLDEEMDRVVETYEQLVSAVLRSAGLL